MKGPYVLQDLSDDDGPSFTIRFEDAEEGEVVSGEYFTLAEATHRMNELDRRSR